MSIVNRQLELEFLHACEHGEMDVIDNLIDKVDINCTRQGNSGLMLVCQKEEPWVIDVVQKLLAHGIDVDLEEDCYYCNALDHVLGQFKFNKELASLLLFCSKQGINRLDKDEYNYFAISDTDESDLFLIDSGIDINYVSEGKTILDRLYDRQNNHGEDKELVINRIISLGGKRSEL